jgi:hypothetical protein
MTFQEDFIAHYGIKGMKWGVKNKRTPGVSRSIDRMARKDAKESALAKMYYGEGAGTRRKLINKSVEAKIKRDPNYAKAFAAQLAKQDLSVAATKAVRKRSRTDKTNTIKKTGKAAARQLTGEMGTAAAFVGLAATGYAFSQSPKGQQIVKQGMSRLKNAINKQRINKGARYLRKYL